MSNVRILHNHSLKQFAELKVGNGNINIRFREKGC